MQNDINRLDSSSGLEFRYIGSPNRRQYVAALHGMEPLLAANGGGGRFYRESLQEVGSALAPTRYSDLQTALLIVGSVGVVATFAGIILGLAGRSEAEYAIIGGLFLWIVASYVLRGRRASSRHA